MAAGSFESRRGSPSRTGRDRFSLSPGLRRAEAATAAQAGVGPNLVNDFTHNFEMHGVAAEYPKGIGPSVRGPSEWTWRSQGMGRTKEWGIGGARRKSRSRAGRGIPSARNRKALLA